MADVNEELVRRYFERQGYFVRTNVAYRSEKPGHSDIDLVAYRPMDKSALAVEVKGWHMDSFTPSTLKEWKVFGFKSPEAEAKLGELFPTGVEIDYVLVVGSLGRSKGDEVIATARERGVKILEFDAILRYLIKEVAKNENAPSEGEHVIRLLKIHQLVEEQE